LQIAASIFPIGRQSVNSETEQRHDIVIDDCVQKYRFRIERFLVEDYAFIE
jgi:hypothetical protein